MIHYRIVHEAAYHAVPLFRRLVLHAVRAVLLLHERVVEVQPPGQLVDELDAETCAAVNAVIPSHNVRDGRPSSILSARTFVLIVTEEPHRRLLLHHIRVILKRKNRTMYPEVESQRQPAGEDSPWR